MPDEYNLDLEAGQINDSLKLVFDAKTDAFSGDPNMITSGGAWKAVNDEATARIAGDAALDGRVTALERPAGVAQISSTTAQSSFNTFEVSFNTTDVAATVGSGISIDLAQNRIILPTALVRISFYVAGHSPAKLWDIRLRINGSDWKTFGRLPVSSLFEDGNVAASVLYDATLDDYVTIHAVELSAGSTCVMSSRVLTVEQV